MIPFDLPPKPALWVPPKPAIIRAASMRDLAPRLAMPMIGTFAAASVRGLRPPAGLVAPSVTYADQDSTGTDGTNFSFTNKAVSAAGNRTIALAIMGLATAPTTVTLSSVLVGGVSMTQQKSQTGANGQIAAILTGSVPSGTTATVSFTTSATMGRVGIALWAMYNLTSITAITTSGSNSDPATLDLNVVAGNILIVCGYSNDSTAPGCAPTGFTERFDANTGGEGTTHAGGDHLCVATESPRSVSMNWTSAGNSAAAAATFG